MNINDANQVRPLVDSIKALEGLEHYVNLRVITLKDSLVQASTFEEVQRIQGAIKELLRFKTLRDEVNNPL